MGKVLRFSIDNKTIEAGIVKLERDKVYGYVEELVSDKNGQPCTLGNLLDDGRTVALSGSTSIKTVNNQFQEVENQNLKMVTLDGSDAVMIPSSFDVDNVLELGSMNDVFNLEVKAIYQLQWQTAESKSQMLEILNKSGVLRFIFNYRTDYEGMDALLIESNQEIFLLAGQMLDFDYLENKIVVTQENTVNVEPEEEEDLDFGML